MLPVSLVFFLFLVYVGLLDFSKAQCQYYTIELLAFHQLAGLPTLRSSHRFKELTPPLRARLPRTIAACLNLYRDSGMSAQIGEDGSVSSSISPTLH